MNFKLWFVLSETLDALTKGALEKYQAPPDELAAFIKELEDNPNQIDRKDAFARLAQRFPPTKQKPVKQEDGRIKLYKDKLDANQITKPEFDTFMLFKNESNKELVTEAMNLLRRFVSNDIITLELKNNKIYITKDDETKEFNDFARFESELHSIEGSLTQYKQKSGMFNPIIGEKKYRNNLAAKGENVWVFRGDTPDLCRIFGKNQIWCISSSSSAAHWFDYRIRFHQTQYFVFDFNKDENDPARYVNPGVAPEGMYSEWVDAKNSHTTDPEDNSSQVGINGYASINQYKMYLASKDIPESIWTTTEPEDWEKRLQSYSNNGSYYFEDAKKDPDPRVFPIYLRIVYYMEDEYFDMLDDNQKREFVFGKSYNLTTKQFEFAKDLSGYYNSLDLDQKVGFANKTKNQDLMFLLAKNPELSDNNIRDLLKHATNKDEMAKIIIQYKKGFSDEHDRESNCVHNLLYYATNKDEIAKLIINKNIDLYSHEILTLLDYATNKDEIIKRLVTNDNISYIFHDLISMTIHRSDEEWLEKRKSIFEKLEPMLSGNDIVLNLLQFIHNYETMNTCRFILDELLGSNYINKLSAQNVYDLIFPYNDYYGKVDFVPDVAKIIIKHKSELTQKNLIDLRRCFGSRADEFNTLIAKYHHDEDHVVKYRKPSGKYKHKLEWFDNFTT